MPSLSAYCVFGCLKLVCAGGLWDDRDAAVVETKFAIAVTAGGLGSGVGYLEEASQTLS